MLDEFRMNKEGHIEEGRCKEFSRIIQCNGVTYDLQIYILMRKIKETKAGEIVKIKKKAQLN